MRRLFLKIKTLWLRLFNKEPKYSSNDLTVDIAHRVFSEAKKGHVNIYDGTITGLRNAVSDINSTVYVVEITRPVEKKLIIRFREYVNKLRDNI